MADPWAQFVDEPVQADPWAKFVDDEPVEPVGDMLSQPEPTGDPKLLANLAEIERQRWMDPATARSLAGMERIRYMQGLVPFLGDTIETAENMQAIGAMNRIKEGTASDEDYGLAATFIDRQKRSAEAKQQQGILGTAAEIALHVPKYIGEFALTGGGFGAGKQIAAQGLKAAGAGAAKSAAAKLAVTGLEGAAGIAAQTAVNPAMVARNASERALPKVDAQGNIGDSDGFIAALPAGFLDSMIELGSERAGGVVSKVPGVKQTADALKRTVIGKWLTLAPGRTPQMLDDIVKAGGWNGVLGEVFEERVGDVARLATGLESPDQNVTGQLATGQFGPAGRQLAAEALGMGMVGGAGAAVRKGASIAESYEPEPEAPPVAAELARKQAEVEALQARLDAYERQQTPPRPDMTPDPWQTPSDSDQPTVRDIMSQPPPGSAVYDTVSQENIEETPVPAAGEPGVPAPGQVEPSGPAPNTGETWYDKQTGEAVKVTAAGPSGVIYRGKTGGGAVDILPFIQTHSREKPSATSIAETQEIPQPAYTPQETAQPDAPDAVNQPSNATIPSETTPQPEPSAGSIYTPSGNAPPVSQPPRKKRLDDKVSPKQPVALPSETGVSSEPEVYQNDTVRDTVSQTERNYGTLDQPNRTTLGEHFGGRLSSGAAYPTINEARKEASGLLGGDVKPGTQASKHVDEAVEQGVVRAARDIVSQAKSPEAAFDSLVDLYNRQPNLSVRTSTSMQQQAYSTPAPLAYLASNLADVGPSDRVYDATAGNGMLLIGAKPNKAVANELNPDRAEALRSLGIDTSELDATLPGMRTKHENSIEKVILNPPFGKVQDAKGEDKVWTIDGTTTNQVDHAIVLNSLPAMTPDGRAVLIIGAKGGRETDPVKRAKAYSGAGKTFFDKVYDTYNVVDHFTVSGDLYSRQGAGFPVDVIVIDGKGKSERPKPWNVNKDGVPKVYETWEDLKREKLQNPTSVESRPVSAGSPGRAERDEPDVASVPEPVAGPPARDDGRQAKPDVQSGVVESDGGRAGKQRPSKSRGDRRVRGDAFERPQPEPAVVPEESEGGQRDSGGDADVRPGDVADGGVAERPVKPRKESTAKANTFQVPYSPKSKLEGVDTLLPRNHVDAVSRALDAVEEKYGNIDKFVAKELGFSEASMPDRFSAEQVDALALAIANHKRGEGFIIGDQTGVGKGRAAAAMIRYAQKQGLLPVFVTEKPDLYGDMIRDLIDIGVSTTAKPFNILATNDLGAEKKVLLPDDRELAQSSAIAKRMTQEALQNWLDGNGLKAKFRNKDMKFDALFTTYSQMQTIKGEEPWRRHALRNVKDRAYFILDESHNAGGNMSEEDRGPKDQAPTRAEFVRELIEQSPGVYYSSATFAKRPEVMDLYARAGMGRAVEKPTDLPEAIAAGGVPLQQVVSEMLAESGQYLRRERSYDGVEFGSKIVDVDLKKADKVTEVFRAIQRFDKIKDGAVKEIEKNVVSEGGKIARDDSTGKGAVESTNFTSILWNIVDQQLMALKADAAANEAIEAHKRGETPIVAIDNTMEAALGHYLEDNPAKEGDPVSFTFADLLDRYLERTREVTIKHDRDDPDSWERHRLTDDEIGPAGIAAYDEVKALIDVFDVEIPASPVDWVRYNLEKAGLKVAEITGRKRGLKYISDSVSQSQLWVRPDEEIGTAGKARTISGINSGKIDALILNRSGATGVSLHASSKFKNQKPRRMIIAQAAKNIDEFMQVLGRVHRTGQVELPKYMLLLSNAPAENRPASVLVKKLAGLNANVTGSASGAVGFDAPDILNEVGDEVVAAYLNDHKSVWEDLDKPIGESKGGTIEAEEGTARKVSGRVALLPVEQQEHFWEEVSRMYEQKIEELDNLGANPLVAKALPLDAKTVERFQIFDGVEDSTNPFEQPAYLEKVSAKKIGKPFSSAEVKERVAEFYEMDQFDPVNVWKEQRKWAEKFREDLRLRVVPFAKQKMAEAKTPERAGELEEQFQEQFSDVVNAANGFSPGTPVKVTAWFGEMQGVVVGFRQQGKSKNPAAPSTWLADVAVADSTRKVSVPVSQLSNPSQNYVVNSGMRLQDVIPEFDDAATVAREDRYIATGNLLAGFTTLKTDNARIVFFTDDHGQTRRGILMPQKFDPHEWQEKRPVVFEEANLAKKFLDQGGMLWSPDRTAWVTQGGGRLIVKTHKSKSKGGKYTLNQKLLDAASPEEFISRGSIMELAVPASKAPKVLAALLEVSGLQANDAKQIARDILSQAGKGVKEMRKTADVEEKKAKRGPPSAGFFGGGQGERLIDDRIAPKEIQADSEEAERQLQAAYGAKPETFLDSLKGFASATAKSATRAQQFIPSDAKHATMNEMFRLQKQQAATAQDEANRNIASVVGPLGPQQLQLFTRKLILDNLLASIDRGEPLRFGFKDRQEVLDYKLKLDELAENTPNVREALDRRREIVSDMVSQLVELKLLPEDAIPRADTYYHQQVLSYLGASRLGRNPQITKKGFQKKRVQGVEEFDESLNYNTSYVEAEHEWMRDAYHQIAKEQWIRQLGERFDIKQQLQEFAKAGDADWRDLVRESDTHRIWQATPGNQFYQAVGVAEHVIEKVLEGVEDTAEVKADDLRTLLAMGGPQREMVLPNELADQLDAMKAPKGQPDSFGGWTEKISKDLLRMWKTWTLFNPLRALTYNLRNLTGDVDPVIGGAVGTLGHANRAIRDLSGYYGVTGSPSIDLNPEIEAARNLGVIDSSMTASEIPDLKDLEVFRRFFTHEKHDMARTVKNYFDTVKRFSAFRESIARYAAFLYYKDALEKGNLSHYGGARKEIVDRLASEMGTDAAAAHLARNLLGDYGDLTAMGNFLREHLIPFYSWQEVNLKRYPMMFYNAAAYGAREAPNSPAKAAALSAGAVGMVLLPYIAMQLFNRLVWPDDEDELSDDERSSPHILLGRNADGSIRILRNTGALGDWLENFGVNTAVSRLDELQAGQMSAGAVAQEMMKDAVNKQVQGLRPDVKAAWEIPAGQSIYPNVFSPRPVRRDDQLAGYLGVSDYYREARGRVEGSGARSRPNMLARMIGVTDPRKNALFEIAELRDRYLQKLGQDRPYRGNEFVANMREAASGENQEAFTEARLAFLKKDGNYEKFKRAIGALDPIHQRLNDADEKKFTEEYLTADQKEKLGRARDYARELEVSMWKMWHEAGKSDSPELAEKIRLEELQEVNTLARTLLEGRPNRLTDKEKKAGMTMQRKVEEWKQDRDRAGKALIEREGRLGRDVVSKQVGTWIGSEVKSLGGRSAKAMAYRSVMSGYRK